MKYDVVIGLEIHAELSTQSKIFLAAAPSNLEQKPLRYAARAVLHFRARYLY